MQSPAELAQLFRERGLKVTPQRACIFHVLHDNGHHPSAEAVFAQAQRQMPTLSLKTVYQTLNDLAEMGQIQQLDLGTGAARFDPNMEPHSHLVCNSCGTVRDLYVDLSTLDVPPSHLQGFEVGSAEMIFRGRCRACRPGPDPAPVPGDSRARVSINKEQRHA